MREEKRRSGSALAPLNLARAANPVVFQHDLPDVNLKGWSVTWWKSTIRLEDSTAHHHPGITLVYVLEGEIRSKVEDGPEKTFGPGQMFLETPGQLTLFPTMPAIQSRRSFWHC